jgi:hypothetical protein
MKIVFIIIASLGLLYFLIRNRKFDFFTVGYLSSFAYFLPGFFGYGTDTIRKVILL